MDGGLIEMSDIPGGHMQLWGASLTSRVFGSRAASFYTRETPEVQTVSEMLFKWDFTFIHRPLKSSLSVH